MKLIIYLVTLVFLFNGCKKFLDVVPKEVIQEDDVYGDIINAQGVLAKLYSALPDLIFSDPSYEGITDEAYNHWENPTEAKFNYGAWGPTDNPLDNWASMYESIRRATNFMGRIESVPLLAAQESYYRPRLARFKAEARFLRAYYYFELFRRYGGVILIDKELDFLDKKNYELPRNSADETVEFIVGQCDSAANELPTEYPNNDLGRITKGAALALKAKALLYAASPLFNGNPLYAGIKNPDGKELFSQAYDKEKWKLAADAAKAVLDLNVYSLRNTDPTNPVNNYAQIFYIRDYTENILVHTEEDTRNVEQYRLPNGAAFGGWGEFSILQDFVDSYETTNGIPIAEDPSFTTSGTWNGTMWDGLEFSNVTNVSNMYKDRDPRFYASVFFQYSSWCFSRIGRTCKFAYFGDNGGDQSDGWPKGGTNCVSGYNMRKWMSPSINLVANSGTTQRNWPIIRIADVYLMYAEALNEYEDAPGADVYAAVNAVRQRVQMPALPVTTSDATKDGMRNRIRNERRVELAFEAHRFWDVRRWLIGEQVDNTFIHGLNAQPTTEELAATGLPPNSEEAGVAVFYKVKNIAKRVFEPRHYLFPIPKEEVDRDPNLVQNYGW